MSEIINLRRARKARARQEREAAANANRAKHGVSKQARNLAKTRSEKERRAAEAHKLDKE